MNDPGQVHPHEIRQFLAEIHDQPYVFYRSLDEARRDPDCAVVLSGDYGAIIFLTVPVRLLGCELDTLTTLVSDLDAVTWMSGDLTLAATVALEHHPVGAQVFNGGIVRDGVWTNDGLPNEVRRQAEDVILGWRSRIDGSLLRRERDRELASKKRWRQQHPTRRISLPWDFDILPPAVPFPDDR